MTEEVAVNGSGDLVDGSDGDTNGAADHDPQFVPIVQLPEVEVSLNEENEVEIVKLRAKLFRFDTSDPYEYQWKERGTGEVKILQHKENFSCRIVMRRDKTLKICANHFITPWMTLKPSFGSDRAWVWTVVADFADETPKSECLAIKFATATIANEWKEKFEEAQNIVVTKCELYQNNPENSSLSSLDALSDSGQSSESEVEPKPETETTEATTDDTIKAADEKSTKQIEADTAKELTEKIASLDVTED